MKLKPQLTSTTLTKGLNETPTEVVWKQPILPHEETFNIIIHHKGLYSPMIIENVILPYDFPLDHIMKMKDITKIRIE